MGDLGSIPGLGRSPGEGKGYPLQYFGLENPMDCLWGHTESDMTQRLSLSLPRGFPCSSMVKNPPANAGVMGSILGSGGPLEKELVTNLFQCPCLENPVDRGAWQATVHGVVKSGTQFSYSTAATGD